MFQRHNLVTCLIVAAIAGASAACTLLAPRYPVECAIGGVCISAFASQLDLPKPPVIPPVVSPVGPLPEPPAPPAP